MVESGKTEYERNMKKISSWVLAGIIFSIPWHTAFVLSLPTIGAPGTVFAGVWQFGILSVTLSDSVLALGLAYFVWLCRSQKTVRRTGLWEVFCIGFIGAVIISLFSVSSHLSLSIAYAVRIIASLALAFCIMRVEIDRTIVASGFVVAGVIQSLIALQQFLSLESSASTLFGMAAHFAWQLGDAVVTTSSERWLRAYGSFPHPNVLAAFLALSYAASVFLLQSMQKSVRLFALASSFVIVMGLFFTFSRQAWFAVAAALLVGFTYSLISKKKLCDGRPLILHGIVFAFCAIIFFQPFLGRFGVGGWQPLEIRSLVERKVSLADGMSLIAAHPLGVGAQHSTWALFKRDETNGRQQPWYGYQPPHNFSVVSTVEVGIAGGLFLVALILYSFKRVISSFVRSATPQTLWHIQIFVVVAVLASFDHYFWTLPSGILLWWVTVGLADPVS
jgi:hypothetical protein